MSVEIEGQKGYEWQYRMTSLSTEPGFGSFEQCKMWTELCNNHGRSLRSRLFNHLLWASVMVNGPKFPGFWSALLDASIEEFEVEGYVDRIIENINMISLNVSKLSEFFGVSQFNKLIWPKMIREQSFALIIRMIQNAPDNEEAKKFLLVLKYSLEEQPTRLATFHKLVAPSLERFSKIDIHEVEEVIEAAWHSFVESAFAQKRSMDRDEQIWDWVRASE